MIVDANLLIYAVDVRSKQHERARQWLEEQLNTPQRVGLPWTSLLAFLRIVTNPRIYPTPLSGPEAWAIVEGWLACPTVWCPQPTFRHAEILGRLIQEGGLTAALIPDAHLAALAIEHDLTLCSADQDFARFPGLRFMNPLRVG